MLFNYNPLRYIRSWFTQVVPTKDRFVKNDKPTQATFEKLENSVAFILERDDRAKTYENTATTNPNLGLQGLVVKNTCANVQARTNPVDLSDNKPYSYAVDATNLPDVTGYPEASDNTKILEQTDAEFSTDPVTYSGNYEYYDNSDGHPMVDEATIVIDKVNDPTKCYTEYVPRISNKFINWIYRGFRYLRKADDSLFENDIAINAALAQKSNYRPFYRDFWKFQAVEWDTGLNPDISLTPLITIDPVNGPYEYVSFKHRFIDDHLFVYFDIKVRSSLSNYLSNSGIAEFRLRPKLNVVPFSAADAPQFPPFLWYPSLFAPGRESNTCLFSGYTFEGRDYNLPNPPFSILDLVKSENLPMTVEPYWVGPGDFYIRIYKPSNNYYGSQEYHNYVSHTKIYPGNAVGLDSLSPDEYGFSLKGHVSFEVNLAQVWLP